MMASTRMWFHLAAREPVLLFLPMPQKILDTFGEVIYKVSFRFFMLDRLTINGV